MPTDFTILQFPPLVKANMGCMFENCVSLKSIDISSFDTTKVMNMQNMFMHCRNIHTLDLESLDISGVLYKENMLYGSGMKIS